MQYPKHFLKNVYSYVREKGGLCIADEVQTGFGRTGEHYWGFESHEVVPDIVTMAKGIGNGFPLGAVVTTNEIAASLNTALHFNTFGGNPLACVVGITVLQASIFFGYCIFTGKCSIMKLLLWRIQREGRAKGPWHPPKKSGGFVKRKE